MPRFLIRGLHGICVGIGLVFLAGCVGNATGQLSLPKEQVRASSYFVQRHDRDSRDLAATIAQAMRARGLNATSGTAPDKPADVAYVLTYTDKWMWDMRMYLHDLRIDLRDNRDQSIVGYGQSMQSSLKAMGQTHEDVVNRALDSLFTAGK
jgi:hypothetical protein